tara:strand:- start:108 stop:221 length:114 start_codon:yes stop_codon:yes gene_type:complete
MSITRGRNIEDRLATRVSEEPGPPADLFGDEMASTRY